MPFVHSRIERPMLISDVFKATGTPDVTYVERDNGAFEEKLRGYIEERGLICLVTGPSKTGKTTLYRKVLESMELAPLVVQCDNSKSCKDIWASALRDVDFSQIKEIKEKKSQKTEGSLGIEGGWKWVAQISGRLGVKVDLGTDEERVFQKIISEACPELLIPILKRTNYILVIEDFHYLEHSVKVELFQKWKMFVDNEIPVIVLETSHRAVEISRANSDLNGRIGHVEVGNWTAEDLGKICDQGFSYLQQSIKSQVRKEIALEAVGLPIIVQQTCLQIFKKRKMHTVSDALSKKIVVVSDEVRECLFEVARERYSSMESKYKAMISGPRERARRYQTYELLISSFAVDPIKFWLTRSELQGRIEQLDVVPTEIPPLASVNSTLRALDKFQKKLKVELIEWREDQNTVFILEPTFLFFVRWRQQRSKKEQQLVFWKLLSDWRHDLRPKRLRK
jgi:AAA domain